MSGFRKVDTSVQMPKEEKWAEQDTNAYKFEVNMVISLFAENAEQAEEQLDSQGGFIISRDVKLLSTIEIHKKENEEE